ncbi:ATP-binding cassette domain-containing protein [Helicobacter sp. NHP22-001]|uniref:ATP-binding cassette domain-containing protein n=1 Tax=Helicobacter sp. NHP22-001 TaxID=3040202 RepID=UPI00244D8C19|nr:ATP-binding cassette domain-containing protein [Helicobacter sp. NHP22-001]GMB96703.1 ABC transporter ATP-binding protein [Helicobacter sp. NHP22-001]
MLSVQDLGVLSPSGAVLQNISFSTTRHLAILGVSGSGKSTLAKAFCGLLPPTFKMHYGALTLSAQAGYVFQDCIACFYPYLKIKDTFAMVLKERANQAKDLLTSLNVPLKAWSSYPYELSRGMASRVQIALNLALKKEILFLDEVTSSLDRENTQGVVDLLLSLPVQRVVITHDEEVALKLCDEVLVLDGGRGMYFGEMGGYLCS